MNETSQTPNIVVLPKPRQKRDAEAPQFKLREFTNAGGTQSWRVEGYKRDGSRVRVNFAEKNRALAKQLELETEYLQGFAPVKFARATRLTDEQLELAEAAFISLGYGNDRELPLAIQHWLSHGRGSVVTESKHLDEAKTAFFEWLDTAPMRDRTKGNLKQRLTVFVRFTSNMLVSNITPETVDAYLAKRGVSASTKDNDRRALSRFFSWCMERPRRWIKTNPAKAEGRKRKGEQPEPVILSVEACQSLLKAAERHRKGRLAGYVAVCLFGGLRPFEAARLTWDKVNLKDRQIRLDGTLTKTKESRVVEICDTLHAWLERYKDKPFHPSNWRRDFDFIKAAAGYGNPKRLGGKFADTELTEWVPDIMRHTAISHYFRKCESFGKTAEQFGNSESIIRRHYKGRVSTEDTTRFYALLPTKKGTR